MTSKALDRTFLSIGVGLMLVAFVAMQFRPFAFGDMRVFDWIAVNGILTIVGLSLVIGVGIVKLRRKFRRTRRGGLSAIAVAATLCSPASAQSFDCAKATTPVEKMICADRELSKLDEEMARAYGDARKQVNPAIIGQLAWLKSDRNWCETVECLKEAYQSRIRYLRHFGPGAAFSLEGLAGEWTRVKTSPQESSHLTVDTVSADGFGFMIGATLSMTDGPITADDFTYHVGQIDGVATRRAGIAVYLDEDTQCRVTFTREGDGRLVVGTSPECAEMGGMGVTFNGEYLKAKE